MNILLLSAYQFIAVVVHVSFIFGLYRYVLFGMCSSFFEYTTFGLLQIFVWTPFPTAGDYIIVLLLRSRRQKSVTCCCWFQLFIIPLSIAMWSVCVSNVVFKGTRLEHSPMMMIIHKRKQITIRLKSYFFILHFKYVETSREWADINDVVSF